MYREMGGGIYFKKLVHTILGNRVQNPQGGLAGRRPREVTRVVISYSSTISIVLS